MVKEYVLSDTFHMNFHIPNISSKVTKINTLKDLLVVTLKIESCNYLIKRIFGSTHPYPRFMHIQTTFMNWLEMSIVINKSTPPLH